MRNLKNLKIRDQRNGGAVYCRSAFLICDGKCATATWREILDIHILNVFHGSALPHAKMERVMWLFYGKLSSLTTCNSKTSHPINTKFCAFVCVCQIFKFPRIDCNCASNTGENFLVSQAFRLERLIANLRMHDCSNDTE